MFPFKDNSLNFRSFSDKTASTVFSDIPIILNDISFISNDFNHNLTHITDFLRYTIDMRITDQQIQRIYVEKNQRDAVFSMSTHHFHPYYELYYLNHGRCRFFINNTLYNIHEGDLIIIPYHLLHYTKYVSTCVRTVVFFRKEDLEQINDLIDFDNRFQDLHVYHVPDVNRKRMEDILENMLTEMRFNDASTPMTLQIQLQEFFLMIQRYCIAVNDITSLPTDDQEVIKAARFISSHYNEHITTKDIAAITGFTPNYLSTKFRETTGIGLHEYLVFTRLHQAEKILLSTHTSITDIALECGFSDSNYFKDAFKKMYGSSPREYKKKTDPVTQ